MLLLVISYWFFIICNIDVAKGTQRFDYGKIPLRRRTNTPLHHTAFKDSNLT